MSFIERIDVMARSEPLKYNRGQIADMTYDEHAKARYVYNMGIAIANGDIPNMSSINKFGKNPNVSQNQDNDIWDLGGTYEFLSAPTVLTLSSATSADDSAGLGARTIKIKTLDDAFGFASQPATMNGMSVVTLMGTHIRGYRATVETAGANNGALATIYIGYGTVTAGVPAHTAIAILPEANQSLMAIMTVPSAMTGYITRWNVGFDGITGTARFGEGVLCSRKNLIRRIRRIQGLSTANPPHQQNLNYPIVIGEKQDVLIMTNSVSANNLKVSGDFDMIFIEN